MGSRARRPVVSIEPEDSIRQSTTSVTQSGTLHVGGLAVRKTGIVSDDASHIPYRGGMVEWDELQQLELLGQGSSGTVYKALHKGSGRYLAVKHINMCDQGRRKTIEKELQTLYRASSPYVVSFFGAFYNEGNLAIALELMDGGSLDDVVKAVGPIGEPQLAKLLTQVLRGLSYLHKDRHLVHRDVKPANFLMNSQGEIKVTDFGVSTELDSTMADCASFVGTVSYMSPERITGHKYSFAADIWALGLSVIEMATGTFPYDPRALSGKAGLGFFEFLNYVHSLPSPTLPRESYSPELCDFVDKCLQKAPEMRASAADLQTHPFLLKHMHTDVDMVAWTGEAIAKMRTSRPQQGASADTTAEVDSMLDNLMLNSAPMRH